MTVINGRNTSGKLEVKRYVEIIGNNTTAHDVCTGESVSLSADIPLKARQTMVLEF